MAVASFVAESYKRSRPSHAFSADCFFLNHPDKKPRGFELHHFPRSEVRVCASSPTVCDTDYADTADSSTGSSCCSSLPSYAGGSCCTEQQGLYCMSGEDEAESCCGGDGDMDITCFFHEDGGDNDDSGNFSFNPETIFLNDAGSTDFFLEDTLIGDSSAENGSWFLNELDSHGQAFLNEVLDQEWIATAVANLEKLNDILSTDSCVLHLFE